MLSIMNLNLTMYDQCGLFKRIDHDNWIKISTEYENENISRLGSVVTNLGYSDWSTTDISSEIRSMWYRIRKKGNDYLIDNSWDGENWKQMIITHLHQGTEQLEVGIYRHTFSAIKNRIYRIQSFQLSKGIFTFIGAIIGWMSILTEYAYFCIIYLIRETDNVNQHVWKQNMFFTVRVMTKNYLGNK